MLTFFAIALITVNALALPFFAFILKQISRRWAMAFLGLMTLESILAAFYTVLTFSGAFGPGILLFFSPCLTIPLSIIMLAMGWPLASRAASRSNLQRGLYLIGGMAIITMQAAPIVGNSAISSYCDGQTMQAGNQIVAALQEYKRYQGDYPSSLETLVPGYLAQVPHQQCLRPLGRKVGFQLVQCSNNVMLLTTHSFNGAEVLRYNFKAGNWSGISLLDGACNYLQ